MPQSPPLQPRFPDSRPARVQPKWRRDFPIETPEDNYVARRDFTKFMVLISGAFATGQFWIAFQNLMRRQRGLPPMKAVIPLEDIPVGGAISFYYPDEHDQCLLIRPGEDTLLAYNQKCTHLHCPVRPQMETARLQCPCHHGYFDMWTGSPVAGPPRRPLPRIQLEVRDGMVYATGVELRT